MVLSAFCYFSIPVTHLVYLFVCTFGFAHRMRYFSIPCKLLFSPHGGHTLIWSLFFHLCVEKNRNTDTSLSLPLVMKSSNDTQTQLGSPWAQQTVWMAAYCTYDCTVLYCTLGMEKSKAPKRQPIETPEGPESELSALLFDAIQGSWKVSPNGTAGIFWTRVHTPPGWVLSLC